MRFLPAGLLGLTLALACRAAPPSSGDNATVKDSPSPSAAPRPASAPALLAAEQSGRTDREREEWTPAAADPTRSFGMLIRTGQASVEIDSLEIAIARVRDLARRVGGYVANTTIQAGREQLRSATLEVKVPAARFDEAVAGLSPLGTLESVNVAAEDVGEEFTDITARVANAHRLEQRLIELLARRTGKLQDVLAVEQELARVREQIERYEGRLRYLKTRSALSTLAITVHERYPIVGDHPGDNILAEAARQAWRNFMALSAGVIASLGVVLPVGALAAGAWFTLRGLRRRQA